MAAIAWTGSEWQGPEPRQLEPRGAQIQFNLGDLGEPAADLRYAPNKLHGDEIEAANGATYREDPRDEWLDHGEIEDLIQGSPALQLLLVDDTAGYPLRIYRVSGDLMKSWKRRLSRLYVSDDGDVDPELGWGLLAHRWMTDDAEALVFRLCC